MESQDFAAAFGDGGADDMPDWLETEDPNGG